MVERSRRMSQRIVFGIGFLAAVVGVLIALVAFKIGVIFVVLGVLTMLGVVLPKRKDGPRIWQSEQGKAV
jgi:hypothetical protein